MPHQPSDAVLENRFTKHRAEIEQLRIMMEEDREMVRIASHFTLGNNSTTWPDSESQRRITEKRWNEYKNLFIKAEVPLGIERSNKTDMLFFAWTWGLSVGGESMSYVYCGSSRNGNSHVLLPCIEQKEAGNEVEGRHKSRYKRIEKDWYLFEEHD
ncbi:MAG: hypothetical protein ACHQYP_12365 [Nitrospiria bacterium]